MANQVGVSTPQLAVDANTGKGYLTATMHLSDGSTIPLADSQGTPMESWQIAQAKAAIPAAASELQTQLTAHGGVATEEDVASIAALVLSWFKLPQPVNASPTVYTGPDVLS